MGCGFSPLSGIICEIVNSIGQGNLTFSGKRQGKAREFKKTSGCDNHELDF